MAPERRDATAPSSPLTRGGDGVTLAVRLAPRAARTAVAGLAEDAAGGRVVKASVTAPPEGGKANAALIALLAKTWKLPKGALSIVQGQADRRKVVKVSGDPQALMDRLGPWIAGLPGP